MTAKLAVSPEEQIQSDTAAKTRILAALEAGHGMSNLRGVFYENGKKVFHVDRVVAYPPTIKRLMDTDAEFGAACKKLLEKNATEKNLAGTAKSIARRRNAMHCQRGHEMNSENVGLYHRKDNGRVRTTRFCLACRHASVAKGGKPATFEQMQAFATAIRDGATISDLTKGGSPLRLMNGAKALLFRRANPRFDRLITKLSADNAQQKRLTAIVRAPRVVDRVEEAMAAIAGAVPRYLPHAQRQDVIAAMALAYADGRLRFAEITSRVSEFVAAEHRQFGRYRVGGLAPFSLDLPAFREGTTPLVETISKGLWQ